MILKFLPTKIEIRLTQAEIEGLAKGSPLVMQGLSAGNTRNLVITLDKSGPLKSKTATEKDRLAVRVLIQDNVERNKYFNKQEWEGEDETPKDSGM